MNETHTAALTVNTVAMLQTQRLAFSGRESVIRELAQNGRRAGARSIHIHFNPERNWLAIIDDGCGISDMNTLLAVAESGWSDRIIKDEMPYGLGFLSALFLADEICVCSQGKMIRGSAEAILAFEQIPIRPIKHTGKTVVILRGKRVSTLFSIDFDELFTGFPVPVRIGSRDVKRYHALSSDHPVIETGIGSVMLYLDEEASESFNSRKYGRSRLYVPNSVVLYYQGFDVYHTGQRHIRKCHVVHLNTQKFKAVAPDRSRLIDEKDVVSRVDEVLRNLCKVEVERRCKQDAWLMLDSYETLKNFGLLSLLNDIDWIPSEVLALQSESPRLSCNESDAARWANVRSVSKESVRSGEVTIFEKPEDETGAFALQMYCCQPNIFYLRDRLDSGHWVWPHVMTLEDISVEVFNNRAPTSEYSELYLSHDVVLCDSYVIHGPAGDYSPTGGMVCCIGNPEVDGNVLLIPDTDIEGHCLLQSEVCADDFGDFRESVAEPLIEALVVWLRRERAAGRPVELLKSLLGPALIRKYPSLIGKRVLLDFTQGFCLDIQEMP